MKLILYIYIVLWEAIYQHLWKKNLLMKKNMTHPFVVLYIQINVIHLMKMSFVLKISVSGSFCPDGDIVKGLIKNVLKNNLVVILTNIEQIKMKVVVMLKQEILFQLWK